MAKLIIINGEIMTYLIENRKLVFHCQKSISQLISSNLLIENQIIISKFQEVIDQ